MRYKTGAHSRQGARFIAQRNRCGKIGRVCDRSGWLCPFGRIGAVGDARFDRALERSYALERVVRSMDELRKACESGVLTTVLHLADADCIDGSLDTLQMFTKLEFARWQSPGAARISSDMVCPSAPPRRKLVQDYRILESTSWRLAMSWNHDRPSASPRGGVFSVERDCRFGRHLGHQPRRRPNGISQGVIGDTLRQIHSLMERIDPRSRRARLRHLRISDSRVSRRNFTPTEAMRGSQGRGRRSANHHEDRLGKLVARTGYNMEGRMIPQEKSAPVSRGLHSHLWYSVTDPDAPCHPGV